LNQQWKLDYGGCLWDTRMNVLLTIQLSPPTGIHHLISV
jgi:hypothetical protein